MPPFGPVYPVLHWQLVAAVLPVGETELAPQSVHTALEVAPVLVEYLPAAQSVHAALPLVVLYLPAAQAVHEAPPGPVNPALQGFASQMNGSVPTFSYPKLHVQLVMLVLPAADVLN